MKNFDRCIQIQNFKKAFKNMDLGHNTTWTEEGTNGYGLTYFGWQDPEIAVFFDNYYIFVYLKKNGQILVKWSRGDKDEEHGVKLFEDGEYDKVKTYVLNFMDSTEEENN